MSDIGWMAGAVRGALMDALALVLPVTCAGCGDHDTSLCEACDAALHPAVIRRAGGVPVWSGLVFEGVPARVVRALKEDGRTGLARALAPALREAFAAAAIAGAAAVTGGAVATGGAVVAVPLPSSRTAYRRRGYRVVELIARRAGLPCVHALSVVRSSADQRGLGREERARNVASSLTVSPRFAREVIGVRVIVIDDVVTTGATLREAVRALRAAGANVIGAATVAATPRHDARV